MKTKNFTILKPWNIVLYVLIAVGNAYLAFPDNTTMSPKIIISLIIAGLMVVRSSIDPSTALNEKPKNDADASEANHENRDSGNSK